MHMPVHKLTLNEYLAWEDRQTDRNEFHRGETFAMVGGRRSHGCVVHNLGRHLGNQLAGSPCRTFNEGMKVQIGDDTVLYPDIFVTCDKADLCTDMIFKSPTLVIEVLSPSTQAYDRSAKFALYRRISSLLEYILIDPETRRVEAFRRDDQGRWVLADMSDDDEMVATSIDCRVTLADVFDGVDPPQ
jgi:Uma2 family endonuclease